MSAKVPKNKQAKGAGISLEPDLIARGKDYAKRTGHKGLSGLVRFLLTSYLNEAGERLEDAGQANLAGSKRKKKKAG